MLFSFKHAGVSGACVAFGLAIGAIGCGDPEPATPQVAVPFSQIGPGTEKGVNDSTMCALRAPLPWVTIGDQLHSVKDGDDVGGAAVSASCTVKPNGNAFDVTAVAALAGQGSITITAGKFVNDPNVENPNIRIVWQRGDTGQYIDDTCVADYHTNRNMGVAAGRVWFHVICPHAHIESGQDSTCQAEGEIKFENCGQ